MGTVRERLRSPRAILVAALAIFLVYSWPGFIGWDTLDHLLQARGGTFSDGHPPAVIALVRICDFFVSGPPLMLLVQAVPLLVGLFMLLRTRLASTNAALVAGALFLFPPISGVTALIAKDGMMAGSLVIGIALLVDPAPRRQPLALIFIFIASLLRWNALAATFAPMILLFRWSPSIVGVRRYAIAFGAWFAITGAAYATNQAMTDREEHLWYWSNAYEDIAGTIHYAHLDDAAIDRDLAGVPLRFHDHLNDRFNAVYNPGNFYQLMRDGAQRPLDPPVTAAQYTAVYAAWKRLVFGHPAAYLAYRWDNFKLLTKVDRPDTWTNVYVWFTVIAAPETIAELNHDATAGKIQRQLIAFSVWASLTPIYWVFLYLGTCVLLLPVCRRRALEASLLLSAVGYQLAWFFLAASTDIRYSQWMELCALIAVVLVAANFVATRSMKSRPA